MLYPSQFRGYFSRIAEKVQEKVEKAQHYDRQRDLILAVYLNERILAPEFRNELLKFIRRHPVFRRIAPFERVVFTGIRPGIVYP